MSFLKVLETKFKKIKNKVDLITENYHFMLCLIEKMKTKQ